MRRFVRSHPAPISALFGLGFGLVVFALGGGTSGSATSAVLAIAIGTVFGAAMFWASYGFGEPPEY
jgi:hypothetical protein